MAPDDGEARWYPGGGRQLLDGEPGEPGDGVLSKEVRPGRRAGTCVNGSHSEGIGIEMTNEQQDQLAGFLAGLLLGAAVGATAAILTAPQSGRKTRKSLGKAAVGTRKRIGKAAVEIRRNTEDRWDELAEEVKGRVDDAISGARKKLGAG